MRGDERFAADVVEPDDIRNYDERHAGILSVGFAEELARLGQGTERLGARIPRGLKPARDVRK